MRMKSLKYLLLAFIFLFGWIKSQAQDAHLSQYKAALLLLNPALTGMSDNSDIRFSGTYRSQWGVLGNSFITTALAVDVPYEEKWGFGAYVLHTDATNVFTTFNTVLSAAYDIASRNSDYQLTVGLQLGLIYERTNDNKLIFDNQYKNDAGNFDGDLPSGERFERHNIFMPEVNMGVFYRHTDRGSNYNPYGGISLLHTTSPKESFIGGSESRLPMRIVAIGGSKIRINQNLFLDPSIIFMVQGKANELNIGMLADYQIKRTLYNVLGGVSYRHQDAIILHTGLRHGDNTYRLSYDINTFPLKRYTNGFGALELSVIYNGSNKRRRNANVARF